MQCIRDFDFKWFQFRIFIDKIILHNINIYWTPDLKQSDWEKGSEDSFQ